MVDKWMNKLWDRKDKILVGKYDIKIYDNKVHYHLIVKRNITIYVGLGKERLKFGYTSN